MELTLDQALQKGVEAHKAGKAGEADRYYTAVLKVNPKHPDANHNMGVLAVSIGKVFEAIPFFKLALEVNPKIQQYWLSYLGALIKLDRSDDAIAAVKQAQSHGVIGVEFDTLVGRLGGIQSTQAITSDVQHPSLDQMKTLTTLYKQGQFQKTLNEALQLIRDFPQSMNLYNIIGAANKALGKLDEAIEAYKKAISIKPDYAAAYNNMGVALQERGNLSDSLKNYNKALSIKPDYADAYNNAGVTLKELGRLDEAIEAYKKTILIQPDYADAYYNMGVAHQEQGNLDEALNNYNKALSIKPDYADAYNNMGVTLKNQGKLEEAIEAYNKALSIRPDNAEVFNNIGTILQDQDKLEEALEAYEKALSIKPNHAEVYCNIGIIFEDQGKLDEAIEAYKKSISLQPDMAEAYNNMGLALQNQGKLDKAMDAYNKALSIKPDYAAAHHNLSSIKKYNEADDQLFKVQELLQSNDLNDLSRQHLSFALSKMYEDIGELEKSYDHLYEGNKLRKKLLKYSIDQDKILFHKLINVQPYLSNSSLGAKVSAINPIPIFIIGMPRSGTTLIEQIISSHSEVTGAGEVNFIELFGFKLATQITQFTTSALSEFRLKYVSKLLGLSNGKSMITDKMPQNFRFIPLICAAFPEAKIIHIQRDAHATCWSNYRQYFSSNGLGYSYDLSDLIQYYNLYKDLMSVWQAKYDRRIYHINYENFTTVQEVETRKLIDYLDLNWEEACLSPHNNKRSVRTASQQQVRQKVYQGSSEAWRRYESFLGGAFDCLL